MLGWLGSSYHATAHTLFQLDLLRRERLWIMLSYLAHHPHYSKSHLNISTSQFSDITNILHLSRLREPYPRRGRIHLLVAWYFHVSQGVGISKEKRKGVYYQYYTGGAGDWEKMKLT
jgi:hypothetical protein